MAQDHTRQFNAQIFSQMRELKEFNPRECLHSQLCREMTVKAHSVPRAILSKMQVNGHVIEPVGKMVKDETGRATNLAIFKQTGINEASTGFFVCRYHDDLFRDIDTPDPDLSDENILNLLMYRATLKELWTQIKVIEHARNASATIPIPIQLTPDVRLRAILDLTNRLKTQIEGQGNHDQSHTLKIEHIVKHIKTEFPFLAGSSATSSSDVVAQIDSGRVAPLERSRNLTGREPNTSRTITVIPRNKDHVVVISYVQGSYAENFFSHIKGANGADLQEAISAELLVFCENWFIHPAVWRSFSGKRQTAFQQTYDNFEQLVTGEYDFRKKRKNVKWHEFLGITNRHQINLFRH